MEKIARATDSQAATYCVIDSSTDSETPHITTFLTHNFDPDAIGDYLDHMASQDPTIHAILANPGDHIFHDSAYISEAEKAAHPYYIWHQRFSDTWHRVAVIARPQPHIHSGVTVHRTRSAGDYAPHDLERCRKVFQHIDRATHISFRLGLLQSTQQASEQIFNQSPFGIIFLTVDGKVVYINDVAQKITATNDGVLITDQKLHFLKKADAQMFGQLLTQAQTKIADHSAKSTSLMNASRPSGKRPYAVSVSPLTASAHSFAKYHAAISVVIADPDRQVMPALEQLQALYQLTNAESKLAAELMNGMDLKAAAENIGIGYQTARTQLTAIFKKTDTNRQSDLVKLLFNALPFTKNEKPQQQLDSDISRI